MEREDGTLLYRDVRPTNDTALRRAFRYNNGIYHPAVMMRCSALRATGFYSEDYPAAEDYEYFLRILQNHKGINLPDDVLVYVISDMQISSKQRKKQLKSRLRIQLDYFDARSPHSYLGVMKSRLAMALPRQLILRMKALLHGARVR